MLLEYEIGQRKKNIARKSIMFNWTSGMIGAIEEGRAQIRQLKRKYRRDAATEYAADMAKEWGEEWVMQWCGAQNPGVAETLVNGLRVQYPSLNDTELRFMAFTAAVTETLLH